MLNLIRITETMLLGMEEAAMEQVSVLVYGEVMEENGKP